MTNFTDLTIASALDGLSKGEFTSAELTNAFIGEAEKTRKLNVFVTETFDLARTQAAASDERRKSGEVGLLEGIPIAMKDLFCTRGVQTTASSKILKGFIPTYESTVSQNMFNQGMVMMGKVALDEFAMGSANITSAYGNVLSPWRAKGDNTLCRIPGGSSGGSAASVSARIALGATGTDTGGSIRQPASVTGITGIKPTYGRCSRWGIIAFASSLDQAGPLARTVEDTAIMLQSMAGWDEKDSTSVNMPVPDFRAPLGQSIKGLKVGIPKEYRVDGMSPEIEDNWQRGIQWLKDAGAEIIDISLPHTKYALATYYILAPAECSSNLARYDGMRYGVRVDGKDLTDTYELTRAAGFGDEVQRRILLGTYVLSAGYYDAYYLKAQKIRTLIARDFEEAYKQVDIILTPTTPGSAFMIGEKQEDPLAMYLEDVFTVPVNLAGLPGMSLPSGLDEKGLPLGLQLIGRPFDEETIFKVAHVLEKAANFTTRPDMEFVYAA
jgi:aspartyl-tRNA(Asn)/glutamyl-tRNA(Gln) amidotransferase subunit A